jgi:membrane protein implicated in regulation of membrane protease activity
MEIQQVTHQDPSKDGHKRHWSQTDGGGIFVSVLGLVIFGIAVITSFISGDMTFGFVFLVLFLVLLTTFLLKIRRRRRSAGHPS